MFDINLYKQHIFQALLSVAFLVSFSATSQESLTVEMKQDTIIINDSTIVDSTKNSKTKSYNLIKDGDSLQLITIDNTNGAKQQRQWILIGLALLAVVLAFLAYYYLKKRKSNILSRLTKQELNIVTLITSGKTNLQIADELCISMSTVKTHINNIYRKLNISSREDLKNNFN